MVELGEHCHTHIIPRLKKVIDDEDKGGITQVTLPPKTASLAEMIEPKQGEKRWKSYQGPSTHWNSSSRRYAWVLDGQSLAAFSKILGLAGQTLHNWVKADRQGRLQGQGAPVNPEQMERARLAELPGAPVQPQRVPREAQARANAPHRSRQTHQ